MEMRAAASLAVSPLFPPPNRVLPSSAARIPSSTVAKPSVLLAPAAAIREPRSRSSTRAYGFSGEISPPRNKRNLLSLTSKCLILVCAITNSDSLVEQAAGGVSAAKSLRKEDEKGFRDSEFLLLCFCVTISGCIQQVLESLVQQYNELKQGFGTADTTVSLQSKHIVV
ncbi:hypothetical protein GW17_00011690 [Ensete ventricosum]|nr:hypothetical protein GW17_00011690 [Ensete ventricosum]